MKSGSVKRVLDLYVDRDRDHPLECHAEFLEPTKYKGSPGDLEIGGIVRYLLVNSTRNTGQADRDAGRVRHRGGSVFLEREWRDGVFDLERDAIGLKIVKGDHIDFAVMAGGKLGINLKNCTRERYLDNAGRLELNGEVGLWISRGVGVDARNDRLGMMDLIPADRIGQFLA